MTNFSSFDLSDFTPYLLVMAAEAASLEFQQHYKQKYGMLRTEWRVLFHLGQYGPMHAKEICDRSRIHKTKVSRAVAALETKRYLRRDTIEEDRRQERLSLTNQGGLVYKDLFDQATRFDAALMEQFETEEGVVLKRCLTKLAGL